MIGGVCSGLAAYLGMETTWVRVILAGFAFFLGTGFLLYFVLWVVVPAAKTTADRLAMRGEPVDVNNIAKAVETSFEKLSGKVSEFGNPEYQARFNEQAHQFSAFIGNVVRGILKVFGGIGKAMGIVAAILLISFILSAWIGAAVSANVASPLFNYISDDSWRGSLATFNVFGVFSAMTILLIIAVRRLLYNRGVGTGVVVGLWVFLSINVACFASVAGSFMREFNHSAYTTQRIEMPDVDILTLTGIPRPSGDDIHINFGNLRQ